MAELEDYLRNQGENPAKLTWYDRLKGRTEEGKETDMIRFGMIGTGKIAEKFWQANRYGKDFELTAVYSRTLERARQFGFQKGQLQYFDDLELLQTVTVLMQFMWRVRTVVIMSRL